MGQKDLTEKILEDYNDVFADIINGLIFDGKQVITPQSLDHASVHSQYKADDTKYMNKSAMLQNIGMVQTESASPFSVSKIKQR